MPTLLRTLSDRTHKPLARKTSGDSVRAAVLGFASLLLSDCVAESPLGGSECESPRAAAGEPDEVEASEQGRRADCDALACESDSDCPGLGARCEPEHGVCLMRCPSVTLGTRADLEAARYCHEIDGDLTLGPTELTRIGPDDLPYLKRVTGWVSWLGPTKLVELTLPALREVGLAEDGSTPTGLRLGFDPMTLRRIALPELRVVHGAVIIGALGVLSELRLGKLAVVDDILGLSNLPKLTKLEVPADIHVGQRVSVHQLCRLSADQWLSTGMTSGQEPTLDDIGCCTESALECQDASCECD